MIRNWLIGGLVLATFATGEFQSARAQNWNQVYLQSGAIEPYFLNTNVGFIFEVGSNPQLARTTDGGTKWNYIRFFDTSECEITQLCFVSLDHGYASTTANGAGKGKSGIYETKDSGLHWNKITPGNLFFSGVYAAHGVVFASEVTDTFSRFNGTYYLIPRGILFSGNDGSTWDSIVQIPGLSLPHNPAFQWIYGNRDSLVATVYVDTSHDTYLIYSTDLGANWQSSALDSDYQWPTVALHISPHSCNIFRQFLDSLDLLSQEDNNSTAPDTYSFLEASPAYTDWNYSIKHIETGAWIMGNTCALYVSYAGQDFKQGPILRSTDNGLSWISDGTTHTSGMVPDINEIDDDDWQNLSVVGYGAVVFAAGTTPPGVGLWESANGGDGTLNESDFAPRLDFGHGVFPTGNDTLAVSSCSTSTAIVYYRNLACAITKLDSISIKGIASSEYSLSSTNHNDCLSLPDTTFISFTPIEIGNLPITVKAHFVDDEYNTIDNTLNFTLLVTPGSSTVELSLYIKPTNITTQPGETIDIPVYLSGNATLGATSITLPFGLDTNVLQPIGFFPAISGITAGSITYSGGTGTVPLQSDSLVLKGETLIGYLRCIVYLADTLATSVTLQSASLTSANSPCVALSLTTDSVSIAITGCGDKTLLQFMKTGQIPLAIKSIAPNPAGGEVQVSFVNPLSSSISYQVMDVLGTVRAEGEVDGDLLTLDVHSLANGLYYLRARDEEVGAAVSGKFVVER